MTGPEADNWPTRPEGAGLIFIEPKHLKKERGRTSCEGAPLQ